MSKYTTWWYSGMQAVARLIAKIEWTGLVSKMRGGSPGYNLTTEDHGQIKKLLADGYYIILTYRKTHFTTYVIGMLSMVKDKKWPDYCHVLMNMDNENDPAHSENFKLIEATNTGVHYSAFEQVFDADYVCLMQPVNMDASDWEAVMSKITEQLGKPYDNLFDINDDKRVSCVEMVMDALKESPNYQKDFPNLEAMIAKAKNLTPQMYRDCPDFKVILEIKR